MPQIRVTVDEKLDKILARLVERGIYQSKAEAMRCALVTLLMQSGFLKD